MHHRQHNAIWSQYSFNYLTIGEKTANAVLLHVRYNNSKVFFIRIYSNFNRCCIVLGGIFVARKSGADYISKVFRQPAQALLIGYFEKRAESGCVAIYRKVKGDLCK